MMFTLLLDILKLKNYDVKLTILKYYNIKTIYLMLHKEIRGKTIYSLCIYYICMYVVIGPE